MGNVTISSSTVIIQNRILVRLTIAILIWENVDLCFDQKFALTSRGGGDLGTSRFKCQINGYINWYSLHARLNSHYEA